ncbi:hypothetical protein [Georgenia sp. AZ-5]|uniref:hypothetical protein n=1 Tax=Georgenia sp. AZ-5 TaxID=3367526 RepID=UPI0037544C2F
MDAQGPTAGGGATRRRYLVVANQTLDRRELAEVIRERTAAAPSEFWVVVPATPVRELAPTYPPMPVMGGIPAMPAPPEESRRHAQEKLGAAVEQLTALGAAVGGEVGDPDPLRAVEDALSRRQFDEIIVSTLPEHLSRWLHQDLPHRLEHKFHLPVTHVAAEA